MDGATDGRISLAGFQEFVRETYHDPCREQFSLLEMAANLTVHTARVLEGCRTGNERAVRANTLVAFVWSLEVASEAGVGVEPLLARHYPRKCPYCLGNPCTCADAVATDRRDDLPAPDRPPETIAETQRMFESIYPPDRCTRTRTVMHLNEEAGELAEAVVGSRRERSSASLAAISEELADVVSWLCDVSSTYGFDLQALVAASFDDACPGCGRPRCECQPPISPVAECCTVEP